MDTNVKSFIPAAIRLVLMRNGLRVDDVNKWSGGEWQVSLLGRTEAGIEQVHCLGLACGAIVKPTAWLLAFTRLIYSWNEQEAAMDYADHLEWTPFDNYFDLCEDLREYGKSSLQAVVDNLSLLSDLDRLGVLDLSE